MNEFEAWKMTQDVRPRSTQKADNCWCDWWWISGRFKMKSECEMYVAFTRMNHEDDDNRKNSIMTMTMRPNWNCSDGVWKARRNFPNMRLMISNVLARGDWLARHAKNSLAITYARSRVWRVMQKSLVRRCCIYMNTHSSHSTIITHPRLCCCSSTNVSYPVLWAGGYVGADLNVCCK